MHVQYGLASRTDASVWNNINNFICIITESIQTLYTSQTSYVV